MSWVVLLGHKRCLIQHAARAERIVHVFEFGLQWYPTCYEIALLFAFRDSNIMCWTDSDTWFFVIFRSEVFLENCFNVLCIISLWWISLNWCTNVMLCFRYFSSGLSILGMLKKSRGSLSYLVTTDFTFVSSEFRVTFRVCDVLSLLTFVWITLEFKRRHQQIANMFHLD